MNGMLNVIITKKMYSAKKEIVQTRSGICAFNKFRKEVEFDVVFRYEKWIITKHKDELPQAGSYLISKNNN